MFLAITNMINPVSSTPLRMTCYAVDILTAFHPMQPTYYQ